MSVRHRVVALAIAAVAVGCGGEPSPPEEAPVTVVAPELPALLSQLSDKEAEGRVIYQSVCWTCHGTGGRGNGPALQSDTAGAPPDFVTEGYADLTVEELETRFQAALEGGGSDPEHPHMRYVLGILRPERLQAALSYVPVLAWPPELPGSAMTGMELYQVRCVTCHGPQGDGTGYAAEALMVGPANFLADTLVAARDFEGLFQRIRDGGRSVHGSSMPPWGVALSDAEIWDLVAYVASFDPQALPPLPGRGP